MCVCVSVRACVPVCECVGGKGGLECLYTFTCSALCNFSLLYVWYFMSEFLTRSVRLIYFNVKNNTHTHAHTHACTCAHTCMHARTHT